jgi:hypothetical protein
MTQLEPLSGNWDDLAKMYVYDFFRRFFKNGTRVERIRTVFVSISLL